MHPSLSRPLRAGSPAPSGRESLKPRKTPETPWLSALAQRAGSISSAIARNLPSGRACLARFIDEVLPDTEIEQYDIRLGVRHNLQRFQWVGAFRDQLEVPFGCQKTRQACPEQHPSMDQHKPYTSDGRSSRVCRQSRFRAHRTTGSIIPATHGSSGGAAPPAKPIRRKISILAGSRSGLAA